MSIPHATLHSANNTDGMDQITAGLARVNLNGTSTTTTSSPTPIVRVGGPMISTTVPTPSNGTTSNMKRLQNKLSNKIKQWKLRPILNTQKNKDVIKALEIAKTTYDWREEVYQQRVAAITTLYANRRAEVNSVSIMMRSATLDNYNEWLQGFGRLPEPSKTKARLALSKIYVNIYDLKDKNYREFVNYSAFRNYTIRNKLIFPLHKAKKEDIKVFLKPLRLPVRDY